MSPGECARVAPLGTGHVFGKSASVSTISATVRRCVARCAARLLLAARTSGPLPKATVRSLHVPPQVPALAFHACSDPSVPWFPARVFVDRCAPDPIFVSF